MPLYEYFCQTCSQKIELLIRRDEKPECPHCHSTKLTKLVSVVSGHVASGGENSEPADLVNRHRVRPARRGDNRQSGRYACMDGLDRCEKFSLRRILG